MASGLLIKQKQLLAGDGIAINHGETASTISLAENALDNAVRIYDATVESSTGVVTITDGTPVTDLRIGDEIRTPDGVYQKTKDSITTGSPADGTRIEVSGITSPAEANGLYVLTETEKVWKHESADYWISQWSGSYWLIANTSSPSNPGISIFYASGSSSSMPWELSNWSAMSGSGSPVLENASTEQIVTDTISLFEYASLAGDVTRLGNAVNQAGGLLRIDLETNAIPEEYLDTSRLLPETPEDGDVPVFNASATTGGGNDETTKFLLQPLAGETSIVDTAAGNPAPVAITVNGTVGIGEEGGMQLDGKYGSDSSITIPANALDSEIFDGEHDFTIDIVYTADSTATGRQCLFGKGEPPGRFDFLLSTNGDLEIGGGPSLGSEWPFDVKVRLTFEVYKQGESWNYTCFRDGAVAASGTWTNSVEWRQNFQPIGSDGYQRWFKGTIWAFRITAGAPHKGQPFTPEPLPWTVPQVVGDWETQNLNEQIDSKIATHNADPSAHPDKLPLSGGQMTGELKINTTDAVRINNGDYGVFFRKDASSFYIMVTAQGDPNGTYTDARPLKIDLATGDCTINGGATKDGNGNVITTTYATLNHPTFSGGVEITGATPYIDFHFNNSESDYTFRVVQHSEDTLTLGGKVNISNNLTVAAGGMSVAGGIKNTGEIQSESYNSYRLVSGNYGTFWRNDGNALYLMLTNSGDQYGSYNDFRPLSVDLATGVCTISGSALATESGLSSTGIYPSVYPNTSVSDDFNTYKTQGNYWFGFGVRPNGPLGDDAETTGVLSVYNIRNTHMLQVYHMYRGTNVVTQQMYYRWCYNNTWTAWASIESTESIGSTSNDFNTLTEPGDYYLSFGENTSNVNAPANGPFHVLVHRYQNAAGTAKPILQIAASQVVDEAQTPMMFFRSASYSNSAWTFQPWLRLLTEKDVKYTTGSVNTGVGEERTTT